MHTSRTLFQELSRFSGTSVETRAENAFQVAIKFMDLLRDTVPDDRAFDLIVKAWFRAVKDNDFSRFRRIYLKYQNRNK